MTASILAPNVYVLVRSTVTAHWPASVLYIYTIERGKTCPEWVLSVKGTVSQDQLLGHSAYRIKCKNMKCVRKDERPLPTLKTYKN